MSPFDQTIEHMALEFTQADGTSILFGVTEDTVLRDHALDALRKCLPEEITLREFRYDAEHLSLLEGAVEATTSSGGCRAVSVTGLEALPRDKRTEAIHLLNLQRNRFGRTEIAVILWVNRATLTEISTQAADFYSWRSATFLIEPPPGWNVLESMRRSYMQALIMQNKFVNLQGFAPMCGGQIVQMRMDDIFTPLRAVQESGSLDSQQILNLVTATLAKNGNTGNIENVQQPAHMFIEMQREPERWISSVKREVVTRRVDMSELLKERLAVILGDPGAGKTTLLHYIAYILVRSQLLSGQLPSLERISDLAECLPVYVRIGEYAQYLQQQPGATLDTFAPIGGQVRQLPLTDELLKDAMRQGRVLFLLDGLDEVTNADLRREVAQRIDQFASAHPQCRMLVTSRIVGYREVHLSGAFSQFTISPLDDSAICRFVQSWYEALEMPERAEELVKAIQGDPSIRRFASNPLLLTVIVHSHWRGTQLSDHRVTLYRMAAETLINQWMSNRRVSPEGWDVQETMQVLLPAIAWYLHSTTSTGLIGEQELHCLLVETLRHYYPQISEDEAESRASQFRRNVSEFSGIFLERGLDQDDRGIFGFLHLTFEEYFAALRLAEKWQREGDRVSKPLLHDPRWTGTILLTAGHFGEFARHQATRFVQTILEAQSEHENVLHRDLLLSARCLADDVRVDADLRRMILSKLIKHYFARESPPALQEDIARIFARFSGTIVEKDVLKALTRHLAKRDMSMRGAAAEALGWMAPAATPDIIMTLLKLLTDPEKHVRTAAAGALGQMRQAAAMPNVLETLLELFTKPDGDVRWMAARVIGQLGAAAATPGVLSALLTFLSDPKVEVSWMAAETLGQLGRALSMPDFLWDLLELLADPEADIRRMAAETLGEIGPAAAVPKILSALLKLLTDDKRYVRIAAAGALGKLGQVAATPGILSTILMLLTDSDKDIRKAAASALEQMGHAVATPEVLSMLLTLLTDSKADVRTAAVRAMGAMGQAAATPEILAALRGLLTDPEWNARRGAARALGQLGETAAAPDILSTLLALLNDPMTDRRAMSAMTLAQMEQVEATPELLLALLKLLSDPDMDVRAAAATAIRVMGQAAATPEILAALRRLLNDPEWSVRWAAVEAIGQMGQAAAIPDVLSVLVKLLTDPEGSIRPVVTATLENLSSFVPPWHRAETIRLFLPLTSSRDQEQRNTAYVALRNVFAAGPA